MKRLIFITAVVAALIATPAMAADMPVKALAYTAPSAVFNWTGAYAGISLGGRWTDTAWTTIGIGSPLGSPDPTANPSSLESSTFRAGGYIGYNWQITPLSVIGAEADAGWGHINNTLAGIPGTYGTCGLCVGPLATSVDSSNVKLGWDGSLRGRIGFLITPTSLLYATGGLAWQQANINATCDGSLVSWCIAVRSETFSTTKVGWTIGGGVEALLWSNWLLRAEYRYADYGNISHTFFAGSNADAVDMQASLKTKTALIGLAYKF
jgi:outer membrane immunogenic protein